MRPLNAVPKDTSRPWFTNCPVGRNTLAAVVKKMCKEVGIEGKTNHSLRATGATELFQAEVPGRLIQQRTGHCSVEALRVYERTTAEQHENISAILSSSSSIQYSAPSITHTCYDRGNKLERQHLIPHRRVYSSFWAPELVEAIPGTARVENTPRLPQ